MLLNYCLRAEMFSFPGRNVAMIPLIKTRERSGETMTLLWKAVITIASRNIATIEGNLYKTGAYYRNMRTITK